ncbi:putative BTB/POZ domain-containing protein [Iris pallida]|uniref:BTB/POZ domain-containing protein n=1 Tax=Iris pallida TaxID=29817 RepID=A0AAX6FBG8_IRIPA|nr:putative BTB/POZ domain-containing protein [Iris pallida]
MFSRKRQRVGSSSPSPSSDDDVTVVSPAETLTLIPSSAAAGDSSGGVAAFNDPATADVVLRLCLGSAHLDLHLHSSSLRRSRYFDALLSPRWLSRSSSDGDATASPLPLLSLDISSPFDSYVSVLRRLYSNDLSAPVSSVPAALSLLPPALHLLFDDLLSSLVRFLEAVPWSDSEEDLLLSLLPSLPQPLSQQLLSRILPVSESSSEEMLFTLVHSALHSHPKAARVKAFVAGLLRDHPYRASVRRILDRAFLSALESLRGLMGEYASPDFRVTEDDDETEALQRLNLHSALANARYLLWLVERMIELRVADAAAGEWGEQGVLAADLQKTFLDDAWRNIAPGLPALVMRCTSRLANAVAAGNILAPRQVRMKLVKNWLPVLNVCQDIVSPTPSGHKMLYQELEETFLRIISTLPMSDAQELLQECLSFSTHDVDDCPHLLGAFKTWFRRANRQPHDGSAC